MGKPPFNPLTPFSPAKTVQTKNEGERFILRAFTPHIRTYKYIYTSGEKKGG